MIEKYQKERKLAEVSLCIRSGLNINLSPGEHNELIKEIVEVMMPQFIPGSQVVYIGDTGEKWGFFDKILADEINLALDSHGKMPDVILYQPEKGWLTLVESVTSHGPIDGNRFLELEELFENSPLSLVYISAFRNKKTYIKYASKVAWETEVWISEEPTHMIHLNGSKFIGPYLS